MDVAEREKQRTDLNLENVIICDLQGAGDFVEYEDGSAIIDEVYYYTNQQK